MTRPYKIATQYHHAQEFRIFSIFERSIIAKRLHLTNFRSWLIDWTNMDEITSYHATNFLQ